MANNKVSIDLELRGEKLVERGLRGVGDAAEDAGDDLGKMAKDAGFLDKRISELRGSTKELAAEFARTGDKDVFKQLRGANRELGQLEKLKKQFFEVGVAGGDETRRGMIKSLSEMGGDMKNALGAAKGPAIGGAVALAAAITPFIGSAIGAAVLGAAGAGGIAGGIALAARDERVKAEATKLGASISDSLDVMGQPFVGPTVDAMRFLSKEFAGSAGDMREALATVAPVLKPLAEGLDGLIDKAMPGLIKGLEAAKPILRVIANELPDLGKSIGDFFEDISEDGDGAVMAMKAIFQATTGVIRATGEVVGGLERAFESTQKWGIGATDVVSDVAEKFGFISPVLQLAGLAAHKAGDNYKEQLAALERSKDASHDFRNATEMVTITQYSLGGALTSTTGDLEKQRQAMLNLVDTNLNLRHSTIDVERAIDEMGESVKENGRSLDIGTEAGRRNTETVLAGIEAVNRGAQAAHDAAIANGATALEAEEAAARYRASWIPALEAAATNAGFNAAKVRELIDELKKLDGKTVTYKVIQQGGRTVGIKVPGGTLLAGNDMDGRASGGPVYSGQLYKVGENGPELIQMGSTDGYVHNASATKAMMTAAPPAVNVSVNLVPSGNINVDAIIQMLWPAMLKQVRIDGGDLSAFGAAAPRQL